MIASDVMTRRVLAVGPDETVDHAANLMLRHGISGLFVVDAKGALCGVVTEGDLLRRDEIGTERHRPWWLRVLVSPGRQALDFTRTHGRKVSDVMTPDVIAKHTAHLRELDNEGKLVFGGPFADDPRGLLVLNCGDKAAAEAIMNVDPLIVSGVSTFRLHTWLIGNADNNYSPARMKGP